MAWLPNVFNSGNSNNTAGAGGATTTGSPAASQQASKGPANTQMQGMLPTQQQMQQGQQQQEQQQQEDQFGEFRDFFPQANKSNNNSSGQNNNNGGQQQQTQQQQQQQGPKYEGYTMAWDNKSVQERLNAADFVGNIDQEMMTKAMSGDAQAFMQVLNTVARNSTMASMRAAHTFVDHGVKTGLDRFDSGLDDRMRSYNIRSNNPEHEILSDPAVQPMVESLKERFSQDPSLSPKQINDKVVAYFQKLSGAMGGSQQKQQQQTQDQGPDWMASLGL